MWSLLKDGAEIAPIFTALIALVAASIAVYSLRVTRDVARRRAAIDFFLKTETDKTLLDLYESFRGSREERTAMTTEDHYRAFKRKQEYKDARAFLNLLELIAVGINQKAFSDVVSYMYWGDILLRGYTESRTLIEFIRKDDGTAETCKDLEKLHNIWEKRAARARS
jgi:hypothetical protein